MDIILKAVTFLLVALGLVGLIIGLIQIKMLTNALKSKKRIWLSLFFLVCLFIIGYILFAAFTLISSVFYQLELLVSIIFAGGGSFVALVTILSRQTIYDIQTFEEIKQLNKKLLHDVNHDDLTGLYKRSYFKKAVNLAIENLKQYDKPSVVFFIDLNKFKYINDNYGHIAGDHVLIELAKLFRQHFRKTDILARVGGDEFAILLIDTNLTEANKSLQRLLNKVSLLKVPFDSYNLQISIAIGIAEIQPHHKSVNEVIIEADKNCYQSKIHA